MSESMVSRRERLLGSAYRLFYDHPLHIVKGQGVWLFAADGRRYLDCYNNVPHVGHCHPRVVRAICEQAAVLNTHTRYLHEAVLDLAELLTARYPDGLDVAMFACSGTEANELALRLARAATGHTGLICTGNAYHGTAVATAQITMEDHGPLAEHVATIPAPHWQEPDDLTERYLPQVEAALDQLDARGHQPAALIVDTILSSEGLPTLPAGYLRRVVDLVRARGGLFIADEVQAGFGRTGSHFWGFQRHGVSPDIATMGKPMGNGHPVSAVVTSHAIVDRFSARQHYFNTFGGNPVSCAAARAVLQVMDEERLQDNARAVGAYVREQLHALARVHDLIGDIRGAGLFCGVALRRPAPARLVVNHMRERGVLIGTTGPAGDVLKVRPPMVFTREHADLLIARLDEALGAVRR